MSRIKTSFDISEKFSAFYTGGQIQITSDGSKLFCGCGKEVKVVDLKSGREESSFGHEEEEDISQFVLTKDDEFLVLATSTQLFRQWRWRDKTLMKTWRSVHTAPVACLAFDPTVTLLASGSADSTAKVWDITRGYYTHNFRGHTGVVRVLAFHPDPAKLQLVSGGEDYTLRVWDLKTSSQLVVSQCHTALVTSLAFADQGNTMYSGGRDNVVCVWKTDKWKVFKTIPVFEPIVKIVVPLEFPSLVDESKGSKFITVSSTGDVRVVSASTGQREYSNSCRLSDPKDGEDAQAYVTQAALPTDGGKLVLATYDHNILMLNTDFTLHKQLCGHLDDILSLALVGTGGSHVAVATNTDLLKLFDRSTMESQLLQGHDAIITCVDAVGNFILSASKDSSVRLWQLCPDTGYVTCIARGQGHTQAVQAAALARAGQRPAWLASGGVDMTVKLWGFPGPEDGGLATHPLRVTATTKAHDKDINGISVAPNDKLLVTASQDKTAKLWAVSPGGGNLDLLAVLRGHRRGVWQAKFSPVDQIVATASGDGEIKLWSIADYSCVRTFEGHDSSVLAISFLSEGRQILSSGSDGLLKLWLVRSSECLATLSGHSARVWALAVAPPTPGDDDTPATGDASWIMSGGADSTLLTWKDVTQEEEQAKVDQAQKQIVQEQVLANLLADGKHVRALGLALSLNRPHLALTVLKEVLGQAEGGQQLERLVDRLKDEQIGRLLQFVVDWNTSSRHCGVAQALLQLLLSRRLPVELLALPGAGAALEALTVYTERHLQRLDSLLTDSYFADYCYSQMKTA